MVAINKVWLWFTVGVHRDGRPWGRNKKLVRRWRREEIRAGIKRKLNRGVEGAESLDAVKV